MIRVLWPNTHPHGRRGIPLVPPEFVHQLGGIHGAQSAGHVVAGDSPEARHGERLPLLGEGHRVVASGDVHDSGRVLPGQLVQRRVEQAQPVVRELVGDGDNTGELRRGLTGATEDLITGRDPGLPGRVVDATRWLP